MRGERSPGPGSHIPAPTPARPPARPGAHSPCPGSCAPASVRAHGEPRAGRAPGVPPSPPLYPAGAASPIARPLLCAGPDSMHSSYSGGGAPAAPGARVSARGRERAARSRGAPTTPDGRRGRRAAGASLTPSDGRAAPLSHGHAPLPRHPPGAPPDVSTHRPGSRSPRAPRAGRRRVRGAAGPDGFALLTRAECRSRRRQPGILCPTAAAGAVPGAGTEPGDPPGALLTSARRAPEREREGERNVRRYGTDCCPRGRAGRRALRSDRARGKRRAGGVVRSSLGPAALPSVLHASLLLSIPPSSSLRPPFGSQRGSAVSLRVARGSGSEVPGVFSAPRCPTPMLTRMQTLMHTDPHRHVCTLALALLHTQPHARMQVPLSRILTVPGPRCPSPCRSSNSWQSVICVRAENKHFTLNCNTL